MHGPMIIKLLLCVIAYLRKYVYSMCEKFVLIFFDGVENTVKHTFIKHSGVLKWPGQ